MRHWTAALLAALAGHAAAEPAPLPEGVRSAGLIAGWRETGGPQIAAIEIQLAPGWHTYWRVPGVTGIPPQFDWSASVNLASVAYDWPQPLLFETYGSVTIGYKSALVLPVRLTPQTPGAPMDVTLDLFFGVCNEICVPAQARLTARLEPGAAPVGRDRIEAALAERPLDARAGGVTGARCALTATGDGHRLEAEITLDAPPAADLTAVIEADARPDLWIHGARTRTEGQVVHATALLDAASPGGVALDRGALRLTLLGAARAVDIRGCAGGN